MSPKGKGVDTNEVVKKFLGKVNPTGWRTNRKAALDELEGALIRGDQVTITESCQITQLLVGTKQYPKGLLKICGEHSVSNIVGPSLTRASVIALRLLSKLLDKPTYSGAAIILDHLKNIPVSCLSLPNFAHHLIRDHTDGESGPHVFEPPMRVISHFLCNVPNLHLSDFIPDDWARYFYLRHCLGYHNQAPDDMLWKECLLSENFSHSIILEFLLTSKHRMARDIWLKNINSYIIKCKPILKKDTIEILMAGTPKTAKGLLKMCSIKKSYSSVAKELLAQMLDSQQYPDSGRIADFLLERRDLLSLLNYPQVFEKHQHAPVDTKIYNTLMTRAKVGEVKDVLILLHGETPAETIPLDSPSRSRRNTSSLDNFKKSYGKMHRKTYTSASDIAWGDKNSQGSFPSTLSMLDEPSSPSPSSSPILAPTPYSPANYPTSPDLPSSFLSTASLSPSTSPASSSPRTSDEFPESVAILPLPPSVPSINTNLPFNAPSLVTPPTNSPRSPLAMESFRAQDMVIATLEKFFQEHSPKFSRIEYRRLLIFLKAIVTSHNDESFANIDSLFSELGLNINPQYEASVSSLFEVLGESGVNFTDELCVMWTGSLMREIAATERNLDP